MKTCIECNCKLDNHPRRRYCSKIKCQRVRNQTKQITWKIKKSLEKKSIVDKISENVK